MPAKLVFSPDAPENARRFPAVKGPIADLFHLYLEVERLVNRPFQDDLHLGERFAAPASPPVRDRSEDPDDGDGDDEAKVQEQRPFPVA